MRKRLYPNLCSIQSSPNGKAVILSRECAVVDFINQDHQQNVCRIACIGTKVGLQIHDECGANSREKTSLHDPKDQNLAEDDSK